MTSGRQARHVWPHMTILPSMALVSEAAREGYAVPGFCVWDAESICAILAASEALRAPVMLMNGPGEFPLFPPAIMSDLVRTLAPRYRGRIALHLDHGDSIDIVKACLEAGYTSVMLDYSHKDFDENVRGLAEVVALARPRHASVEGELGAVGRVGDEAGEGSASSALTDPGQAREYVERTGVNMLAVSIGNAHGIYTRRPTLDFERLKAIRAVAGVPLVLHGGSGTPEEQVRRAVSLGVAKVNVASELMLAVRKTLSELWREPKEPWVPKALVAAGSALQEVAARWIRWCGAEGRLSP